MANGQTFINRQSAVSVGLVVVLVVGVWSLATVSAGIKSDVEGNATDIRRLETCYEVVNARLGTMSESLIRIEEKLEAQMKKTPG